MATSFPEDLSLAQWNYLLTTLRTEAQSGRIQQIKDIRPSLDLWTREQPAAGVQITDLVFQDYASGRLQMFTEFTIRIAAQAQASGTIPPNGDIVNQTLWPLISDGNGNGFSPILRDRANFTLGGTAASFKITRVRPFVTIDDGETGDVWAEAYITAQAWKIVSIT